MGKEFSNERLSKFDATPGSYTKCAHTHKPLKLKVNGEVLLVYGGSANSPIHKDCDIYVALDGTAYERKEFYPWNNEDKIFVAFYITDMSTPKDVEEFKKMVKWLKSQILLGRKIHIGCIGGHGRTGTLLAALVMELTGEVDAISYVRKNYCSKAVESTLQVDFLHTHFGIKKVQGHKSATTSFFGKGTTVARDFIHKFNGQSTTSMYRADTKGCIEIKPMRSKGSIWYDDPPLSDDEFVYPEDSVDYT